MYCCYMSIWLCICIGFLCVVNGLVLFLKCLWISCNLCNNLIFDGWFVVIVCVFIWFGGIEIWFIFWLWMMIWLFSLWFGWFWRELVIVLLLWVMDERGLCWLKLIVLICCVLIFLCLGWMDWRLCVIFVLVFLVFWLLLCWVVWLYWRVWWSWIFWLWWFGLEWW